MIDFTSPNRLSLSDIEKHFERTKKRTTLTDAAVKKMRAQVRIFVCCRAA